MAKFFMSCPSCGNYVEGKTGFFARKKLDCSCGYTIHVRTDKLMTRQCPHCGNQVVMDQTKGEDAACPVCHGGINTFAEVTKLDEFNCAQCGIRLSAAKGAEKYTCPVCDFINDVPMQMKKKEVSQSGAVSIIKYEGTNDTLVWKHPLEDFNMGSQLIVHESQEVIFFRNGEALDLFPAGRYTLETQSLPLLDKLYELPSDMNRTFHSEVYYINLTTQMGIKWGTDSKVRLFDPVSGLHIEIGASGEFNIRVTDSRKVVLRLVGTEHTLKQEQLLGSGGGEMTGYFRALVMTQVKSYLAQVIKENEINVLEIDARLDFISAELKERINRGLQEYGLTMPEFFITKLVTPDDDPNYRRMKQQYADRYLLVREQEIRRAEVEAEAERRFAEEQMKARMKIIGAQGEAESLRLQKQAEADAYRMQAEAEAAEMRMKGYTYQQETARQVGLEAMQNGITGGSGGAGGGTGALGDLASLGVTLGAMGGVIGMTRDAMNPIMEGSGAIGSQVMAGIQPPGSTDTAATVEPGAVQNLQNEPDLWECSCGNASASGRFCNMCGQPRPVPPPAPEADTWNCSCGSLGMVGRFCSNCGRPRPEREEGTTDDTV